MTRTDAVYGPGRAAAAFRAITQLDDLEAEAESWAGFGPSGLYRRLAEARAERALYPEYATASAAWARIGG